MGPLKVGGMGENRNTKQFGPYLIFRTLFCGIEYYGSEQGDLYTV